MRRFVLSFAGLITLAMPTLAQQAPNGSRAQVLVLGTYHMANRGHDIFNMQVDDVLAPRRQSEIVQLIEVLKKFNPTKIAIERDLLSPNNWSITRRRPDDLKNSMK